MAKDEYRYPDHREPLPGTASWHPDEFIFGITRGACAPARRMSTLGERELLEARLTFEETYPRYPFAELVRLSIVLGRWLARVEDRVRQSFAGAKSYPKHFDRPASSSHR